MKIKQITAAFLIAVMVLIPFNVSVAWANNSDDFIGRWSLTGMHVDGDFIDGRNISAYGLPWPFTYELEFKADGTLIRMADNTRVTWTERWERRGGYVVSLFNFMGEYNERNSTFHIDGNLLIHTIPSTIMEIIEIFERTDSGITPYGRAAAEAFLSELTTIFDPPWWRERAWIDGSERLTGRYGRWDSRTQESVMIYERPPIFHNWMDDGFFDINGVLINTAPWMYVRRGANEFGNWSSYFYADYFKLYDLDNNGIPVIFVHFNQTFEGCYGGFYRVFRYIDGEYRMLEMTGWVGSGHELFKDNQGRIITFINCELIGMRYEHLVLTNEHALLNLIAESYPHWQAWQDHHWNTFTHDWTLVDSWRNHNPTIFGTNIPITPIQPLTALQQEITESITLRLRAEGMIR